MAYDRDGTVFVLTDSSRLNPQIQSSATALLLNNENTGDRVGVNNGFYTFIFPELRDIVGWVGYYTLYVGGGSLGIYTSVDTTNGSDGTWVSRGAWNPTGSTKAQMRQSITAVSWLGVKAVAFGASTNGDPVWAWTLHLYGNISAGQTPDRLRFWHPTLDEPLDDNTSADGSWLDFGDTTQGTTADKTFRVKNNSSTLTANSINITTAAPTDTSPTLPSQFTFSDGGAFATSLNVGNLAPGAFSNVITIRRTTPSNAVLSLWWARVTADPGSWT
jgi:hypothetical protein